MLRAGNNKIVEGDGNRVSKIIVDLPKSKKLKNNKSENLTHISNIGAIKKLIFLTSNAKEAFNRLKQTFIKVLIFQYFNLESHIQIEINALGYAISRVFCQLSIDWVASDKPNLAKFKISIKSNFG